jgi:hypothetical protein
MSLFRSNVLKNGNEETERYVVRMLEVFPNLGKREIRNTFHIALYEDTEIVGGVSLESHSSLKNDLDILSHWNVSQDVSAIRLLRLWSVRSIALPYILSAIVEEVPKDAFLYGILSLPLEFAKKNAETFDNHLGWLEPRLALENCSWCSTHIPTSEGKKLLSTYKKAGAHVLGAASGSVEDKSIRIVMGMNVADALLPQIERKYETATL